MCGTVLVGLAAVLDVACGCCCCCCCRSARVLDRVVAPADAVCGFCGCRRMSSTLLSLLASARVELGVERVTLDSELEDRGVSGLDGGKLPGRDSVGSYPASMNSSKRLRLVRRVMV